MPEINTELVPGQEKNMFTYMREVLNNDCVLITKAQIQMKDWRYGKPTAIILSKTPHTLYAPGMPQLTPIELTEVAANRTFYHCGANVPLESRDTLEKYEDSIFMNFLTDFINGANANLIAEFFSKVFGSIDYTVEYAGNNVGWDYKLAGADDDAIGLNYEQVRHAKTILKRNAHADGFSFSLQGEHRMLLFAPADLQESFEASAGFNYSNIGIPGARYDEDYVLRTDGIQVLWLENDYFVNAGLCTNDIDSNNHKGIYAYLVDSGSVFGVTSLGSEIFLGTPSFTRDPDYLHSGELAYIGRYATGAQIINKNNCVRIGIRLEK